MDLQILFEDDQVLAVSKPADTLVVPSPWTPYHETLIGQAKAYAKGRVWPVHRLDRDTSGVVLLAKTPLACKSFHDQFQGRTIKKVYEAIVKGHFDQPMGNVTLPVGKGRRWSEGAVKKDGDFAQTLYRVKERCGPVTHLAVYPQTGRFHQVRIHLAAVGHPLAFDPIYHKENPWPWVKRVPLHAASITFQHPATGKRMTVEAPLLKDLRSVLFRFRSLKC